MTDVIFEAMLTLGRGAHPKYIMKADNYGYIKSSKSSGSFTTSLHSLISMHDLNILVTDFMSLLDVDS